MKYEITIDCGNEAERTLVCDIIRNHELISTIFSQSIENETHNKKVLTLCNGQLLDNLYTALTDRTKGKDY